MKKIFLTVIALLLLWSCQTDKQYEDLNRDPKHPTQVAADFLFTSATVSLEDRLASPNVNDNIYRFLPQYLTTTTYTDEPNYDLTGRNISGNLFAQIYQNVILDMESARENVMADESLSDGDRQARIGQIEVIEVLAYEVLVDSFGDIPYSQAINATEYPLPAYDDDAEIYSSLITRLEAAAPQLQAGQGFNGSTDVIYGGDMDAWYKFANSLSLRLGVRLSDVNPSLSKSTSEAAISRGVFTSNSDNATVEYQSSFPNTNPLWEDLVQSGRADYLAANTLVDYMNSLNDPRRQFYFDNNLPNYKGGIYGASNSYYSYTHIGTAFLDPTREGIILDYAEVEFNLTEAARLGYAGAGSAESHYKTAITASINYWGGSDAAAMSYLSQSSVSYKGTDEQLGLQYWIAMFDNPFQGWNVWRKYDAPDLNTAVDSGLPVPLRYTYPISEQNLNQTNYDAASSAIGGDKQQTPVFWDVQ